MPTIIFGWITVVLLPATQGHLNTWINFGGRFKSDDFIGTLAGSSQARYQQAARWFLISFSTGGCYSGNTARVPHEEMSACNELSCLAFLN